MLDRDACERRVYRLAVLLTGNPISATKVIERVVNTRTDLRRLDNAHMDRLTILRSRELTPATLAEGAIPHQSAEALASLRHQHREAWILTHVYRLEEREMARAMDCSTTAIRRHRELAEESMRQHLQTQVNEAAQALLEYSMSLDVPEFFREERRRNRHRRIVLTTLIVALSVGLIVAGVIWLTSASTQMTT